MQSAVVRHRRQISLHATSLCTTGAGIAYVIRWAVGRHCYARADTRALGAVRRLSQAELEGEEQHADAGSHCLSALLNLVSLSSVKSLQVGRDPEETEKRRAEGFEHRVCGLNGIVWDDCTVDCLVVGAERKHICSWGQTYQ